MGTYRLYLDRAIGQFRKRLAWISAVKGGQDWSRLVMLLNVVFKCSTRPHCRRPHIIVILVTSWRQTGDLDI